MKQPVQRRSILIAVVVAALAAGASALGPPPTTKDALWGGGDWGKTIISQKIVNNGDTVTITATLVGGPPKQGYYCSYGNWAVTGTSGISINIPGCFQLVDYSPKADSLHNVSVSSGSVSWSSIIPPSPRNIINARCYCYDYGWGNQSWTDTCPENFWPTGMMGPGDSVSVTLKATCGADTDWGTTSSDFGGNWGVGWGDSATDYYKIGGQEALSFTAVPTSVPANGTPSALTALVFEQNSGVNLPGAWVSFSPQFGILNTVSAETDSTGIATAFLASPGRTGPDLVTARTGKETNQTTVTFTKPVSPPTSAKHRFGIGNNLSPVGEPVHAGLGNYIFSKTLFAFPGKGVPFAFELTYNSLDNAYNGPLGPGWTHSYNVVLTPAVPPSTDVTIKWGDGHEDTFHGDGAGNFTPTGCTTPVTLTIPDASHYLATLYDKSTYEFDSGGHLLAITDLNGNQIAITYSSTVPGEIDHITDTTGREIAFTYNVAGLITSITSPLKGGNTVAFQYDSFGNLTGIIDPRGKTWGFTYDGSHRILTHVDAKGTTVVTNAYDGSGRVVQQTDGAGHVTTYQYNVDPSSGTTTTITPPSGNAVTHVYDLAYNLISSTDGEGRQAAFATDLQGRLSGAIDKRGAATQMAYGPDGNPMVSQDRTGARSQFTFNAQNRPTSVTDPLNHATSFGYDANGNLTGIWNANGDYLGMTVDSSGRPTAISDFRSTDYSWSVAYDSSGLPQTVSDPNGASTGFTHDAAGRPTQITLPIPSATAQATYDDGGNLLTQTDPLGNVTSSTYDDNGNLLTRTFVPTGATTTYEYDWAGRPVKGTDALGGITTYAYDQDGNLVTVTDPDGVTLTRQYDKSNRLTAAVDALTHHVYYGYDANGNVTSVKNEISNTWTTTFDAEGRPLQTADPLGNTATTAYEADGRVTSVTDPLGNTVTFQYDPAGRLISKTFPDQGVINYVNDKNGQPIYLTDPLGHTWSFYYDGVERAVQRTDPDGNTDGFGYDGLGRLTQKTLRDGTVISYSYDADSRLTSVSLPGQTITYAYDAAGNMTGITDPSGTTTMTYDKLGRRLTRTDSSGKTIAFTYTAAGRLKTMTYPGSNVVTYAYDTVGRLSTITDWNGNHTSLQYDSVNRVTQATLPNSTRTSYTYDDAGRVVSRVSQTSGGTVLAGYTYAYDAAGHITSVQRTEPTTPAFLDSKATYTYDPVNRVLTATVDGVATTYAFDLKGDLVTKTSAAGTTSFTFDALNRLASVSDETNTTTYTYDGAGNRLAKTFNGATTKYVREGGTVYCTLDGSGNVQSYNVYAGSLLYSLDAAGAIKVYHGDERGSVVAITDASQNVVQSYSYDPYGKVLGATGGLANAFQYVGANGVLTDEDGLYHMQARYYDPDARRFITEDPLGLTAGLNLYGYADGDPINAIDPAGDLSKWEISFYGPEKVKAIEAGDYVIGVGWVRNGPGAPAPPPVPEPPPVVKPAQEPLPPALLNRKWRFTNSGPTQETYDFVAQKRAEFPGKIHHDAKFITSAEGEEYSAKAFNWGPVSKGKELDEYAGGAEQKQIAEYEAAQRQIAEYQTVNTSSATVGDEVATVAGESSGAALFEMGGELMLAPAIIDVYMGPPGSGRSTWDSSENRFVTWEYWKKKNLWDPLPPWAQNTLSTTATISGYLQRYGNPITGPTMYMYDWVTGKNPIAHLDGLCKMGQAW
ncbi:MAG: RHS repeat-associated core domain-containing protein [Thermoanaerobaculales bacterium]